MNAQDTTLEAAEDLVAALQSGDESAAANRVMCLVREFENGLYQEIGQLTRVVHEAVKGLCEDSGLTQITTENIPDAKQRLDYVMERTAEATHRTLNSVESMMPLPDEIVTGAKDLKGYWIQAIKDAPEEVNYEELSRVLDSHVTMLEQTGESMRTGLSEVMMAQEFQDLTGQVIRRTMELVADVEAKLLELVMMVPNAAAKAEGNGTTVMAAPEGPAVIARDDVVSSQDEVDDLLTSLGF